ncbi:MAG: hypothetical protein HC918_13460, partial [Oscillatoriales cyanobacterium SM2_1_8]|nr:hypothetical protein [Oscillatoriales cyanobacterium SM2_1_8]
MATIPCPIDDFATALPTFDIIENRNYNEPNNGTGQAIGTDANAFRVRLRNYEPLAIYEVVLATRPRTSRGDRVFAGAQSGTTVVNATGSNPGRAHRDTPNRDYTVSATHGTNNAVVTVTGTNVGPDLEATFRFAPTALPGPDLIGYYRINVDDDLFFENNEDFDVYIKRFYKVSGPGGDPIVEGNPGACLVPGFAINTTIASGTDNACQRQGRINANDPTGPGGLARHQPPRHPRHRHQRRRHHRRAELADRRRTAKVPATPSPSAPATSPPPPPAAASPSPCASTGAPWDSAPSALSATP